MENIKFTMGALALKLLGTNLYSNPWAALSELIANGHDAGALKVRVLFNRLRDGIYNIYVVDNGSGMNENDIQNYAKIGFFKRDKGDVNPETVMGRKGIGKLATLFLSEKFDIITRKNQILYYSFDFSKYDTEKDEEVVSLEAIENYPDDFVVKQAMRSYDSFSIIKMFDVDLAGYGAKAFEIFETRIANLFSTEDLPIDLIVESYDDGKLKYENKVKKRVAFKNMILINSFGDEEHIPESDTEDLKENPIVKVPKKTIEEGYETYERVVQNISDNVVEIDFGEDVRKYPIYGWIGMHSTITKKDATKNDDRFEKNSSYNPIQLRVYVRKKLAINNLLDIIKNNQTYASYVEGEIHFDALDLNEFKDIATTNRQSVDENDIRVVALVSKLQSIINSMISKRNKINNEIKEKIKKEKYEKLGRAKKNAYDTVKKSLGKFREDISDVNLTEDTINKVIERTNLAYSSITKGEVAPEFKDQYLLFLSHSTKSKVFSDFLYDLLKDVGVKDSEIFYTAKQANPRDLNSVIKKNITEIASMMVYFFSKDFRSTDYPMFEAGAGWATKSTEEILVFSDEFDFVPTIQEFTKNMVVNFENKQAEKFFIDITAHVNCMIDYLNKGRDNSGKVKIDYLSNPIFPTKAEGEKAVSDCIDSKLFKHLSAYEKDFDDYLEQSES